MNDDYKFDVSKKRPEDTYKTPLEYFDDQNITRYSKSKSLMRIQERITIRALELLELEKGSSLVLDAGTGPGFAAVYLNQLGYTTVGIDLIFNFLKFYKFNQINPVTSDMCFLPFKPESFDAIISISALQWIIRDIYNHNENSSMTELAKTFYNILKPESKVVFQFYPKNDSIMERIGKIFLKNTPFYGQFVIDNPDHPKKRKIYLVLQKD